MSFSYLPWFTGDYFRDTRHLSPLEHGVYLLLLAHCWDQKGPLPLESRELANIVGARSHEEFGAIERVVGKYFVRMEDGYYNRRMQLEVEKSEALSRARSVAGRAGYQAKAKQLLGKCQASAKQVPLSPSPSPSLSPSPELPRVGISDSVGQSAESGQKTAPDSAFALAVEEKPKGLPPCPYEKIVQLWRECLPQLPAPKLLTEERKRKIAARWRWIGPESEADGLAWLRSMFANGIAGSKFLTGRSPSTGGRPPFRADIDFVFRSEQQFVEIYEGKYLR